LLKALATGASAFTGRGRSRLKHWIAVPQIACSVVLLLVAGVLVRTTLNTELADMGYDPNPLVFVEFRVPTPSECDRSTEFSRAFLSKRSSIYDAIMERARSSPSLTDFALSTSLPYRNAARVSVVEKEAFSRGGPYYWIDQNTVTLEYYDTLRIPLVRGRAFDSRDLTETGTTAIVSESLARKLWPGKDPIGQYLTLRGDKDTFPPRWKEVVGVAKDLKPALSLGYAGPLVYLPPGQSFYAQLLVARGHGSAAELLTTLRGIVKGADAAVDITSEQTVTEAIATTRYPLRLGAVLLAISGLLGLLLAGVGLYGVVSYSVAQRVREIGIRTALGAERKDIIALMIGDGLKVLVVGGVLGVALAFGAIRATSSFVVAIPSVDAATFIGVPLLLTAVVLLACYIPARRATRVDPIVALRTE
jgi:putative ABC transport system permease protein